MDINTVNGVIRAVLPAALAYAVGKGWITQGMVGDIVAAVTTTLAAWWSVASNRKA
jgi:hypothetical protein